ncbi:hypothetical protein I3842_05G241500 [Carya illinoinensis]|uniref:Uncharacterized protein n=1 Tax=Carya illinoinensis TaxID=32201 RepID=A0A922F8E7_CARIL|nr:hypothetical protein I3842_05G241500 [Carya illinoinensis]
MGMKPRISSSLASRAGQDGFSEVAVQAEIGTRSDDHGVRLTWLYISKKDALYDDHVSTCIIIGSMEQFDDHRIRVSGFHAMLVK